MCKGEQQVILEIQVMSARQVTGITYRITATRQLSVNRITVAMIYTLIRKYSFPERTIQHKEGGWMNPKKVIQRVHRSPREYSHTE